MVHDFPASEKRMVNRQCTANPTRVTEIAEDLNPKGIGKFWMCTSILDRKKGNFIDYILPWQNSMNIIKIDLVDAEYCDPKPDNCHCKTLLDSLLRQFQQLRIIELLFIASPFQSACKCYLGTAARLGFDTVENLIEDPRTSDQQFCVQLRRLTVVSYADICTGYEKHNCVETTWVISKED